MAATISNGRRATSFVILMNAVLFCLMLSRLTSKVSLVEFSDNYVTLTEKHSTADLPWPGNLDHFTDSDNVLVVITVTCPYIEMLDNLVESIRRTNTSNVVLVPLDAAAHTVLLKMYDVNDHQFRFGHVISPPPFVNLDSVDSTSAANYTQMSFRRIVSWRPKIIEAFLLRNYTVFYCDTDTYWRSSPLKFFLKASTTHFNAATEEVYVDTFNFPLPPLDRAAINSQFDMVAMFDGGKTNVCTGYLYMKPSSQSIFIMKQWAQRILDDKISLNQPAFENVYMNIRQRSKHLKKLMALNTINASYEVQEAMNLHSELNFRSRVFLDNNPYFPSGNAYAKRFTASAREKVLLIHGNFIIGMNRKQEALQRWGVWKPSGRLEKYIGTCQKSEN